MPASNRDRGYRHIVGFSGVMRTLLPQAFVEQESGIEGAEVASSAPAGNPEGDVSTDYKRFWRELGDALGMQPGTFRPA